jgi:GNAT superfamily N-acetyltransferase
MRSDVDDDGWLMNRETAWTLFIEGFTTTAYARRVATRFRAGPLEAVRFAGDEDRPEAAFEEFFARACAPADALAAVVAAHTLAEHYITALDDQPDLIAAYERGGYRRSHTEALMACDLCASGAVSASHSVLTVRTGAEANWLNTNDPQNIRWIVPDNLADPRMSHYVLVIDGVVAARGRNLRLDEAHSYVSRVYTADAYRRRGLALTLMRQILADDMARGARWSVLTASAMGESLYTKLGYRSLGTIHIFEPA